MKTSPFSFIALLLAGLVSASAQNGKPDAEGFIRDWLVLAPFSISGSAGGDEIDRVQFPEEPKPAARAGATQKIRDTTLTWKKVTTDKFHLDFKELHPQQSEYVIAWAVAYVVSPEERSGLTLRMNSNDQGKVYLNGIEQVKFADTRTLEKDAEDSAANVTLKKGVNILVLKVINEENNWQGSVRFLDAAKKPVTDLKIQTEP